MMDDPRLVTFACSCLMVVVSVAFIWMRWMWFLNNLVCPAHPEFVQNHSDESIKLAIAFFAASFFFGAGTDAVVGWYHQPVYYRIAERVVYRAA